MASRPEQFETFLKKEVASFFDRSVPRPEGFFFSVTHVSFDEKTNVAKVFVSVFPDQGANEAFATLKEFKGEARDCIAEKLNRRMAPNIVFVRDVSQQDRIRLEKLLENGEDNIT